MRPYKWIKEHVFIHEDLRCLGVEDENGDLPLHLAIKNGHPLEIVRPLIQKFPEALLVRNNDGALPLHLAYSRHLPEIDVVRFLLDRCPEAARQCDSRGQLPIHYAARKCSYLPYKDVMALLNAYHDGLCTSDAEGRLPLHALLEEALLVYRSTGAFYAYISEFPESLKIADAKGRLPLHVALDNVYKRNSVEAGNVVVEQLLYKNCHAVKVADSEGRLPLIIALDPANKVPFHITRRLIDLVPESFRDRKLLHAACSNQASVYAIEYLTNLHCSQALLEYDDSGFTPLHIECMNRASRSVVKLFIKKCPESASACSAAPSKSKQTTKEPSELVPPLFLACERDAPLETILYLVQHSLDLFSPKFWAKAPSTPEISNK